MAQMNMQDMLGLTPEQMEIARKTRYAEALRRQSEEPMQGQMVSGYYIAPSWTQGLAKLLSSYQAGKADREVDQQTKAYRQKMSDMLRNTMAQGNVTTEGPAGPTTYRVDGVDKPFASRSDAEQYINANDPKQKLGNALYGEFGGDKQLPANTDFGQYASAPYVAPNMAPKMGITEVPGQPTKTTTFDFNRVMQAAMQNPDNPLFWTAMNYMANQQGQNKTAEMKNWEFAMNLPEPQRSQFFAQMRSGNAPSSIQEWIEYNKMTPEQKKVFMEMKRNPQIMNLGGYQAVRDLGGGISEKYAVTPKPEDMPGFKEEQAKASAVGKAVGEAQGTAVTSLAGNEMGANVIGKTIDDMLAHPGFKDYVGTLTGGYRAMIPGSDAANFKAYFDQLKGGVFMQAYQTLKGGGQITEVEGDKATQALARMDRAQSQDEFAKGAREFQAAYKAGVEKLRRQARGDFSPPSDGTPQGNVMTPAEIKRLEPAMNYLQVAQTQEELSKRVKTLKQKGWSDQDIRNSYGNQ